MESYARRFAHASAPFRGRTKGQRFVDIAEQYHLSYTIVRNIYNPIKKKGSWTCCHYERCGFYGQSVDAGRTYNYQTLMVQLDPSTRYFNITDKHNQLIGYLMADNFTKKYLSLKGM